MWWQDSRGYRYYKRKTKEENFFAFFNKQKFLSEIKNTSSLTDYHKMQIKKAVRHGLGHLIEKSWHDFQTKKISTQDLIQTVNKTLVEKEIRDDEIYFTSTEDFFNRY